MYSTRSVAAVSIMATLFLSSAVPAGQQREPEPPYDVLIAHKVMIAVRDGLKMANTIYFPATRTGVMAPGKFPAILARSPYAQRKNVSAEGRYFAQRGYVYVVGDVRGSMDSEGELYPHINDGRDGYDIIEWLAKQPWSNGAVGTNGGSYLGSSQFATGLTRPAALKAQFIHWASTDYHDGGGPWNQGAWMHDKNLGWSLQVARNINNIQDKPEMLRRIDDVLLNRENYDAWLKVPASRWFELFNDFPELAKWHRDWLDHPTDPKDNPYWKQYAVPPSRFAEYPEVPISFLGGWYDHVQRNFSKAYVGLSKANQGPKRFISGPWVHGGWSRSAHGDIDFGPEAAIDLLALTERWMRQWLKGEAAGIMREAPVRIFVMGTGDGHKTPDGKLFHGGYWRDEQEYPLTRAQETRFYLQRGGGLSREKPTAAAPPSAYAYDPRNPVPTIFTRAGAGYDQRCKPEYVGCTDTLPLSARPDVLVFRTAPFEENVEITGPMSVTLFFSTDVRDTDFTAKLVYEYPPSQDFPQGMDLIVTDALRRARFRNTLEREELLEPGRVYEITIEVPPTSTVFKKGTRLRLDISSSNYPKFGLNPNSGEPIEYHTYMQIANNRIYHDPERASFLTVPVIPGGGAKPTSGGASR